MNGRLIVQHHPLLSSSSSSPLLSSLSLITSFTSLQKRFTSCGISGRKKKRKMLQGNYIYSGCKKREGGRERKNTSEGWVWFHRGGVNANWVKRARESQNGVDRKREKRGSWRGFTLPKKRKFTEMKGWWQKKERKMRGRATWSIMSNLRVNHFSGIKAGFRIPTAYVFVCVLVCVFVCVCEPTLVCVRVCEQTFFCVTSKRLTLTNIYIGVTEWRLFLGGGVSDIHTTKPVIKCVLTANPIRECGIRVLECCNNLSDFVKLTV